MIDHTICTCVSVVFRGMHEYGQAMRHGLVPLNHTLDIGSVPLNGICGVISGDIYCSTIIHKLYTIHFCFLLFLLSSVDRPNDGLECVFVDGSFARSLFHKYRIRFAHPLYFHNESIARDHRVFRLIRIYGKPNDIGEIRKVFFLAKIFFWNNFFLKMISKIPNLSMMQFAWFMLIFSCSYRKLQNRHWKSRGPLSCTALRCPTSVVWRLNDLPQISHVKVLPCRRTWVLKWSLRLNNLLQIGHRKLSGFLCHWMCSSIFTNDFIFFEQHLIYPLGSLCSLK